MQLIMRHRILQRILPAHQHGRTRDDVPLEKSVIRDRLRNLHDLRGRGSVGIHQFPARIAGVCLCLRKPL